MADNSKDKQYDPFDAYRKARVREAKALERQMGQRAFGTMPRERQSDKGATDAA